MISDVFLTHASFIRELASGLEPEAQETLRELLKKLGKGLASDSTPASEAAGAS